MLAYYAALSCASSSDYVDDVRASVRAQVEFYFSDENLPGDDFLFKKTMQKNAMKPVPLRTIGTFNKIKSLLRKGYGLHPSSPWYELEIGFAIERSELLRLTPCGTRVARTNPMAVADEEERRARTVKVSRMPVGATLASVEEMFSAAGTVQIVRGEKGADNSFTVEFSCRESALKSVKMFDESSNWRSGRRVKVMGKAKSRRKSVTNEGGASERRHEGKVHSLREYFGFIKPAPKRRARRKSAKNIYFSLDSIVGPEKTLRVGDHVSFKLAEDEATGDRNAVDVTFVSREEGKTDERPRRRGGTKAMKKRALPPFIQARGPAVDGSVGFTDATWRRK